MIDWFRLDGDYDFTDDGKALPEATAAWLACQSASLIRLIVLHATPKRLATALMLSPVARSINVDRAKDLAQKRRKKGRVM